MYARCPEQYQRRYIQREIIPPGIAMIQGTAVHVGAKINFTQKIESHADLHVVDIIDASAAAFDAEISGGYVLADDEVLRGASTVLGEAKDQTVKMARVHAEQQAPDYQPVAVEHATRILLPAASHDLLAITDLRDDQDRVTDFKTAGKRKPQSEADTSLQLTVYAAAFEHDCGRSARELRLDTVVKTKTPTRQVLTTSRTPRDIQCLANRINAVLAAIQAGSFPPCPPDSWMCCPKFCGYHRDCAYVSQERRSAAETGE
jgi:hypothetical protein